MRPTLNRKEHTFFHPRNSKLNGNFGSDPGVFSSGTTDSKGASSFLGSMQFHRNAIRGIIRKLRDSFCWSKTNERTAEIGLSNCLFSVVIMENNHIVGNGDYCESFGFKARDTDTPGMFQVIM
jgi:hypothetical protein